MPVAGCEHAVSLQGDMLKLIQACTQSLSHYGGVINHFVSLSHYWIKHSQFNLPLYLGIYSGTTEANFLRKM